jgi:hypothetical protein
MSSGILLDAVVWAVPSGVKGLLSQLLKVLSALTETTVENA